METTVFWPNFRWIVDFDGGIQGRFDEPFRKIFLEEAFFIFDFFFHSPEFPRQGKMRGGEEDGPARLPLGPAAIVWSLPTSKFLSAMLKSHLVGRLKSNPLHTGVFGLNFAYFSGNTGRSSQWLSRGLAAVTPDSQAANHYFKKPYIIKISTRKDSLKFGRSKNIGFNRC